MVTFRVRLGLGSVLILNCSHSYSVDGATGVATVATHTRVPTLGSRTTARIPHSKTLNTTWMSELFKMARISPIAQFAIFAQWTIIIQGCSHMLL